jgi:hypothetical protein
LKNFIGIQLDSGYRSKQWGVNTNYKNTTLRLKNEMDLQSSVLKSDDYLYSVKKEKIQLEQLMSQLKSGLENHVSKEKKYLNISDENIFQYLSSKDQSFFFILNNPA